MMGFASDCFVFLKVARYAREACILKRVGSGLSMKSIMFDPACLYFCANSICQPANLLAKSQNLLKLQTIVPFAS